MLLDRLIERDDDSYYDMTVLKYFADQAMRFVLKEDAVMAINDLVAKGPSAFVRMASVARMPYGRVWIEFDGRARDHNIIDSNLDGYDLRMPRTNIGIALHQKPDDPTVMAATMIYELDVDQSAEPHRISPAMNGLDMTLNLKELGEENPNPLELAAALIKARANVNNTRWADDDAEMAALAEMGGRAKPTLSVFASDNLKELLNNAVEGRPTRDTDGPKEIESRKTLLKMWHQEWSTDISFVLMALVFLNSAKIVNTTSVSLDKVNKNRARRGRHKLYSHHTVTLAFNGYLKNRAKDGPGEDQRQHLVRGHWKTRRTGAYYWSAFFRGNPDLGFVDKDYEVVKDDPDP